MESVSCSDWDSLQNGLRVKNGPDLLQYNLHCSGLMSAQLALELHSAGVTVYIQTSTSRSLLVEEFADTLYFFCDGEKEFYSLTPLQQPHLAIRSLGLYDACWECRFQRRLCLSLNA